MEQIAVVNENKPEPVKKARKKRSKAKWIVLGLLLVAVAVVLMWCNSMQSTIMNNLLARDDTALVEARDLLYSISASGTVVSTSSRNVNSTQVFEVKEVLVEVGDRVNAGDPLCILDGESIAESIEKLEMSIALTEKTGKQQVKAARDTYNAAKNALDLGLNASILSAQNAVTTAYNTWQTAEKTYADTLDSIDKGFNTTLNQTESAKDSADAAVESAHDAVTDARQAQRAANTAYDAAYDAAYKKAKEDGGTDEQAKAAALADENVIAAAQAQAQAASGVSTANRTLDSAQSSYRSAKDSLSAAEYNSDIALQNYRIAADNALKNYEAALVSLEAAESSAQTQLQTSRNALTTSQLGSNTELNTYDLQKLYEQLDKTTITAPVSGTITAVYAKVGGSGSGLLFIIEDTDNLLIETSVKEFDIGTVKEGMQAIIESDATKDAQIEGEIQFIAPTSAKTAAGITNTTGDILFPTDVSVLTKNSGLRIGMSVRLNYIIEEKSAALSVPYEAIYTNADGQDCVLTLTEVPEEGTWLISELPVTVGMDTDDLYIEISGEGVAAGLRVINTPETFRAFIGTALPLAEHRTASGNPFAAMMGG